MATGTGNLPNPGMNFTPFDILAAEELNQMVANVESLATGVGIGDGAVTANKIDFTTLSSYTSNGWNVRQLGALYLVYRDVTVSFAASRTKADILSLPSGITDADIISRERNLYTSNNTWEVEGNVMFETASSVRLYSWSPTAATFTCVVRVTLILSKAPGI